MADIDEINADTRKISQNQVPPSGSTSTSSTDLLSNHAFRWGGAFLTIAAGLLTLLQMVAGEFNWDPHVFTAGIMAMIAAIPALIARITIKNLSEKSPGVQGLFFSSLTLPVVVFSVIILLPGSPVSTNTAFETESPVRVTTPTVASPEELEPEVPKAFREVRIQVAPSAVIGGKSGGAGESMGIAIPMVLAKDLDQHPQLDTYNYHFAQAMRDEGISEFRDMTLPFIKDQIKYDRFDYLVTSEVDSGSEADELTVDLVLWRLEPLQSIGSYAMSFGSGDTFFDEVGGITEAMLETIEADGVELEDAYSRYPLESFFSRDAETFYLYVTAQYRRWFSRDPVESERLLKEALAIDGRFALAWAALANTYMNAGNNELSEEPILMALRYQDRLDRETSWDLKYYKAYVIDKNYQRAEEIIKQFIVEFPLNIDAREGYVALLQVLGRHQEGVTLAQELVALTGPEWAKSFHTLGHAAERAGQLELALKSFETVADLQPNEVKSWSDLASIQQQMGMSDEADDSLRKQAALDTGTELGYLLRSVSQNRCRGDFTEAEAILADAAQQALSNSDKYAVEEAKQRYFLSRGRVEPALLACVTMADLGEKIVGNAEARVQRIRLGRVTCETGIYFDLVDQNEVDWDQYREAGRVLNTDDMMGTRRQEFFFISNGIIQGKSLPSEARSLEEAFDDLMAYSSPYPGFENHNSHFYRATYYQALGQLDDATAELEQLLAKNPGDPDHYLHLAEIANTQGQGERAFNYLSNMDSSCPFVAGRLIEEVRSFINMGEREQAAAALNKLSLLLEDADPRLSVYQTLESMRNQLVVQ